MTRLLSGRFAAKVLLCLIASLAVFAANGFGESPIDAALRSYVNGRSPLDDIRIQYEIGNPDFEGRDELLIAGDGTVRFERSENGRTQSFAGSTTANTVKTILREMLEHEIWTVPPPEEPLLPDAAEIEITVSTGRSDANFAIRVLETEAIRDRRLSTLIRIFNVLMDEVSRGSPTRR